MKSITENTRVTISLVLAIIGGILWLSRIHYMEEATADALKTVVIKQDAYNEDIAEIKKDIAVIKVILEGDK